MKFLPLNDQFVGTLASLKSLSFIKLKFYIISLYNKLKLSKRAKASNKFGHLTIK